MPGGYRTAARENGRAEKLMSARRDSVPLVTFALGEHLFAADVREVERVLKVREVSPVPNTPDWLLGMMPYRDTAVPLLDLRRRFELPDATSLEERRMVIFGTADGYIAAVVDRVLDVKGVDPADLEAPPALVRGLAREYVRAVFRRDGCLTILLDAARLLSATERLALVADA